MRLQLLMPPWWSGANGCSIRAIASSGRRARRASLPSLSEIAPLPCRARLEATVLRRAPQVMVKVTGGGRGMAAVAAHFRYIAKAGRFPFEDDRGVTREGKEALSDLVEQWRYGGSVGVVGATWPPVMP